MEPLIEKKISTVYGEKSIAVFAHDIREITEPIDIMAISSFFRNYENTPGTLLKALADYGIDVYSLSRNPEFDLREQSNIWLSREIFGSGLPIKRIGCIEMTPLSWKHDLWMNRESQIISSIQAYFHLLHIASLSGAGMETVGMPLLGTGNQQIDASLITVPTINECIKFMKSNEYVKRIWIINRDHQKAFKFAMDLEKSYSAIADRATHKENDSDESDPPYVFISYSSKDRNIADNLCAKMEAKGIKVWYAPRNIHSQDYASAIVDAISKCTHFAIIISKNSLQSHHVLNEIDLAFQEMNRHIVFCPLRIDEEEIGPAFKYYLSRQHWMDAHLPPLEEKLNEFVDRFIMNN